MREDMEFAQLTRYVFGEYDAEEAAALARWVAEDPGRSATAESLRKIRDAAAAGQAAWDTDAAWQRLMAPSARPARPQVLRPERSVSPWPAGLRASRWAWLRPAVALAAAVALVVAGGVLSRGLEHRSIFLAVMGVREAATSRGERAMLTLSDGTRVILGVESRLRAPYTFDADVREVTLDGEAYFDVAPDHARPFVVHTRDAVTRVLGTKFAVRAYAEDRAVQVVVAEGRVALGRAVLTRGMLGRRAPGGEVSVRQDVNVDDYLGWTTGRLTFDDTPFTEVARRLGQWYDLDVRIADPAIASRRLTGSFADGDRLEDVLRVIALAMDFDYERDGRIVRFSPKRPAEGRYRF